MKKQYISPSIKVKIMGIGLLRGDVKFSEQTLGPDKFNSKQGFFDEDEEIEPNVWDAGW